MIASDGATGRSGGRLASERVSEVLGVAIELQSAREAHAAEVAESGAARRALDEAARELGLSPALLQEAEATLARRDAAQAERLARRQMRWLWLARTGLVAALLAGAVLVGRAVVGEPPVPPGPWTTHLEDRSAWQLSANDATEASLEWVPDRSDKEGLVAALFVNVFVPGPGHWDGAGVDGRGARVDVASKQVPDFSGLGEFAKVTLELQGTLPRVQLALGRRGQERWVSPPLEVVTNWRRTVLPLNTFVHQRLAGDGTWRDTLDEHAPAGIDEVRFVFGEPINSRFDSGVVRVRELRVE